ncbi:MAG: Asp-tRNA(Asn)/Glu-tRNA(Gln) amidotransferase subunit GatA [Parcubacteria group bacterium]|nr:Asp-tRNA(Asn)/Glu-tRNA(Gln) amidotransferase subunit GatA [Parcubacteria group bacterium]
MIELKSLTISKARKHLIDGDFTAGDLTDAYLKRIGEKNPDINAYLEVFDDVRAQAEKADRILKENGDKSPALCGIPFATKDNILIRERTASCGSKILEHYRATYDAGAIRKLKEHNPVFLGRANMDEFAMGSSNERSAYGLVRNPLDETRAPGGSSGGPAAAVAMDGALAALGSDTGGSVRQPASFCGIVGLKPTYGAVSRSGLIAMASSFDQIGPLAKTVEDVRLVYEAISGNDPKDSTSFSKPPVADRRPQTKTIGVPDYLEKMEIDEDVRKNFDDALEALKDRGYKVKTVSLPNATHSLAVYYILMPAEASTNLARFDGVKYGLRASGSDLFDDYVKTRGEGFGAEVKRRIILGTYVLSAGYHDAFYAKAVSARQSIAREFVDAFAEADVIATPTTPTPPFKLGEKTADPLAMYLADVLTVPANIAGIPALSVPAGTVIRDGGELPVGIQFMGPHYREDVLFAVGEASEASR